MGCSKFHHLAIVPAWSDLLVSAQPRVNKSPRCQVPSLVPDTRWFWKAEKWRPFFPSGLIWNVIIFPVEASEKKNLKGEIPPWRQLTTDGQKSRHEWESMNLQQTKKIGGFSRIFPSSFRDFWKFLSSNLMVDQLVNPELVAFPMTGFMGRTTNGKKIPTK